MFKAMKKGWQKSCQWVQEKAQAVTATVTGVVVGVANALAPAPAKATSLIDFTDTALTTAATNITDTGTAASEFVLPIIIGVVAIMVGIKLFKKFANKI